MLDNSFDVRGVKLKRFLLLLYFVIINTFFIYHDAE